MSHSTTPPVATLAGPTAVGKTQLSLALARQFPVEIVSADSMQVYRRLDIGTAKPSPEERATVPHHLIDVADPRETYDLARFLKDAAETIDAIRARGKLPLVVGGTGLYLKSLITGIFAVPSRNAAVRQALTLRAREEGLAVLHEELRRVDAPGAARISPNDAIRIIRALEVYHSTGRSMSEWHADPSAPQTPAIPLNLVVLTLPRETLNERIERRVGAMLEAGWIEEVRQLLSEGLSPEHHCFKALGYREIARRLVASEPMVGIKEAIARETRQFAKRQMTWFRAMKGAQWIGLGESSPERVMEQIRSRLRESGF